MLSVRPVEIKGTLRQRLETYNEYLEGAQSAGQTVLQHRSWSKVLRDVICLDELNVGGVFRGGRAQTRADRGLDSLTREA